MNHQHLKSTTLTWECLSSSIKSRHPLAQARADAIRFVLAFAEPNMRVGMILRRFDSYGHPCVEILADLGEASRVESWIALHFNSFLTFGALTVCNNVLLLRAVLRLENTNGKAVEFLSQRVAGEAAEIKLRLHAPLAVSNAFDHYGD